MVFVLYDCFVYHLFFLSLSLNISLSLHLSTPPSQDPPLAEKALERGSPARLHLQHLQCYITMKYSKESQHVSTSKPRHRQHRPPLSVTYNYLVKHKSTNPAQTQHNPVGSVIPQVDLVEYMGYTETIYWEIYEVSVSVRHSAMDTLKLTIPINALFVVVVFVYLLEGRLGV